MYILGISAWYHDSAACIVKNGTIIAAAQEERFSRIKHDANFPKNSIEYCISEANISPDKIKNIVFYEKPFLKFERLLETYLAFAPKGFSSFAASMPIWIKDKLFQKTKIIKALEDIFGTKSNWMEKLIFSEHHLSHAASSFFPSPFKDAAILTIDGVGEWTTTSVAEGTGNKIKVIKEIHFPHSIGLLYSAFTYYIGFKVNSGEYKVMGLAPYGTPKYVKLIKDNLIDIKDDGSFKLNMEYFDYCTGLTMTNEKFNRLFKGKVRKPETRLTQKEMDLAASVQKVCEEVILKLAKSIKKETNKKHLCLAGGVALNCVANGILQKEGIFEELWIQPASGDAGGALGAALSGYYIYNDKPRKINLNGDSMKGSFLGPNFSDVQIEDFLSNTDAVFKKYNQKDIIENVAKYLSEGKAIGWMQGRMEFGPRSLGCRSIIADPRSEFMQKQLNLKVKFRESFRPFAPSILFEHIGDWFEVDIESPYMLLVSSIKDKVRLPVPSNYNSLFGISKLDVPISKIPAVTHVDFSARVQTVHKETNPIFHSLIKKFFEITGCPILVNTSFNVRGEPIVCNPEDAFRCFMGTNLDVLVIGNYILNKRDQKETFKMDYKNQYELD